MRAASDEKVQIPLIWLPNQEIQSITRKPASANGGRVSCSLAINPMHSQFLVGVRALGGRQKEFCASLSDVCHILPDEINYAGSWFVTQWTNLRKVPGLRCPSFVERPSTDETVTATSSTPFFALTSLRSACDTSKEKIRNGIYTFYSLMPIIR